MDVKQMVNYVGSRAYSACAKDVARMMDKLSDEIEAMEKSEWSPSEVADLLRQVSAGLEDVSHQIGTLAESMSPDVDNGGGGDPSETPIYG